MGAPPKATKMASDGLVCCLSLGDSRWELRQRQLKRLPTCFFAASAEDPMKPTKVKGSNHASGGKILLPFALGSEKNRTVDPHANGSTVLKRKVLDYMRSGIINQLIAICLAIL